jgi:hypothetical protein
MTRTTTITLQTPWDCRFSRPGYRLTGVVDRHQPEPLWVCVQDGRRRPITTAECADCPRWQMDEQWPPRT